MLVSRCGSRTGARSSAKDSGSVLSGKDLLQKTPNKPSCQKETKGPSRKRRFQASGLPQTPRLVRRLSRVLRLVSNRSCLESSTSTRASSPALCLSRLLSYPSCSLTAVRQKCRNAAALGYTLNPWCIHVWTCSCTTQKKTTQNTKPCRASYGHEVRNRCSCVHTSAESSHCGWILFFKSTFFFFFFTHFVFAWCKKTPTSTTSLTPLVVLFELESIGPLENEYSMIECCLDTDWPIALMK